jgi:CubicO group peptidase (beta-lactamase class C family)
MVCCRLQTGVVFHRAIEMSFARLWLWTCITMLTCTAVRQDVSGSHLLRITEEWMRREGIPGGALAVRRTGEAAVLNAMGRARQTGQSVRTDTLFWIASLSKPLTAASILRLVQQGALSLKDRVLDHLPHSVARTSAIRDSRWLSVTIEHLLMHTGGWDAEVAGDPIYPVEAGRVLASSCADAAREALSQPLQFEPGHRYAYSNLGYCLLGLVIELKTSQPYWEAVLSLLQLDAGTLLPGSRCTHENAQAALHYGWDGVAHKEVTMSPQAWMRLGAAGGWCADVAATLTALGAAWSEEMKVPRPVYAETETANYYGLGWRLWPLKDGRQDSTHFGTLPGQFSMAVRLSEGVWIVGLFNGRPHHPQKSSERLYARWAMSLRAE